ncbi:MAG: polyamine aminopropyltransferase [Verrucomicrobia bacterium]|nr:polyamine aminopropyltransferase [Verrucomicrobiota bacterium]
MFHLLLYALPLASSTYSETLYPEWGQWLENKETIYEEKTEHQDLIIFENPRFGRVLSLDGNIQTTTADEPIYHEMMVHVPLLHHANPTSILIIGGGDGGILREVLRHQTVQKAILVEIDGSVIERSQLYLPSLSNGAFSDPRASVVVDDGAKYVKETTEKFDVIICDSTDPVGPGKVLFTPEFYGDCKKLLKKDGIFVNQNGVPFLQKDELSLTLNNRQPHFKHVGFYVAPVPTYVGGFMAFGWASDKSYRTPKKVLQERMARVKGKMVYYTPDIHLSAFALPQFMLDEIEKR